MLPTAWQSYQEPQKGLGQPLTCPGALGMLGFQQVPPGHRTLLFLKEHRTEPANSSVQCRPTWGAVFADPARLVCLDGVRGVTANIQGRLCLRACPVLPLPRKECDRECVCVRDGMCVCAPMVCECASGMQCVHI